jgi:SAM-dependent methyltransferase
MSGSDKPEFDKYAEEYTNLHRTSIELSGEDPAYFSAYKAKYMAKRLGEMEPHRQRSILDFGCGVGNSISHLKESFPDATLYGADLSGESVKLAHDSHAHEATFDVIENGRIPFPDDSFDVVMAACVFHHIPLNERGHWIDEIRRVLKPGGHMFVFEHNVLNPLTVKTVRDCPFDEDAVLLPRSELMKLAGDGGFQRTTCRYIVFFPHALGYLRPLEDAMGWIPFGAQYVVHGVTQSP